MHDWLSLFIMICCMLLWRDGTETPSFHLPIGEMSITLDDVPSLIHLLIRGRLLNHFRIYRSDALDMILQYLRVDSIDAQREMDDTRECHARFVLLNELYKYHLTAAVEVDK